MRNISVQVLIKQAAERIRNSRYTVVLTGAGISTPSGIPDFRSPQNGLWTHSDPMEVASLTAFRHHPDAFYNWLRPLAQRIISAKPNPAHQGLAVLEQAGYIKAVITQNIDGLHQSAGSREVIEIHGSMKDLVCPVCRVTYSANDFYSSYIMQGKYPRCSRCNAYLKPNITLFEEMLPVVTWERAMDHSQKADLFIVIGSSLEVMPAASLPLEAIRHGAKLIINTLSPTPFDHEAELIIHANVSEVLPAIAQQVLENSPNT